MLIPEQGGSTRGVSFLSACIGIWQLTVVRQACVLKCTGTRKGFFEMDVGLTKIWGTVLNERYEVSLCRIRFTSEGRCIFLSWDLYHMGQIMI